MNIQDICYSEGLGRSAIVFVSAVKLFNYMLAPSLYLYICLNIVNGELCHFGITALTLG